VTGISTFAIIEESNNAINFGLVDSKNRGGALNLPAPPRYNAKPRKQYNDRCLRRGFYRQRRFTKKLALNANSDWTFD
jgi:hypothetical protein